MLTAASAALAAKGVITNRRKRLHPGVSVASFLLGTREIYDYARQHPEQIALYPSDYVNDPFIIGQIDNMVAINTALQIDLTGQVCSDSIGARFYSGIGGQVDFLRGAARSKGGRPIIALPSTADGGTVSRIVPRLEPGGGVVTTRGDVHYVVTEYGVAYLHGKSIRERALALIELAHPKFRPWLLAEAKRRKFVYADQVEPPVHGPLYPKRYEKRATDKKGEEVLLRPVRASDEGRLHDLYYAMSDESLYRRFFQVRKLMPHATLQKLCNVDYEKEMSIVATVGGPHAETIVGAASYTLDPTGETADAAFVVDDRWQGRGLGRLLLTHLADIARKKGVKAFTADVLASNGAMLHLFGAVGGTPAGPPEDGVATYRIPL
jgi:GNAT superfamily N-acetyltransferase